MSLFWPCRYRLADAGKALRVELDSLDGLGGLRTVEQAAEDGGSALLRQVAIAEVGFTATDPEGAALAATLTLNVFAPLEEMTCKAQDHYLEQRGSVVSCKRCPTRLAASDGSSTCDICAEGHFRLTADAGAAASCRPCPLHRRRRSTPWWTRRCAMVTSSPEPSRPSCLIVACATASRASRRQRAACEGPPRCLRSASRNRPRCARLKRAGGRCRPL